MSLYTMIGLIGLLYIVIFGGLALFRRESLSTRFAVESIIITAVFTILAYLTSIQIHPVIFLIILYLVTLRVRILSDLGVILARRGYYTQSQRIYNLAAHLWPDQTGDLIIKVNLATLFLQKKQLIESIALFNEVLSEANKSFLGVKFEAAAHYNLGVAYLRSQKQSMAMIEFNNVLETWPASLYARRASEAMERLRKNSAGVLDEQPTDN